MEFNLKHLGSYGGNPATILELTIKDCNGTSLVETVSNFKDNKVDEDLIFDLRQLADELEYHNDQLKNINQ